MPRRRASGGPTHSPPRMRLLPRFPLESGAVGPSEVQLLNEDRGQSPLLATKDLVQRMGNQRNTSAPAIKTRSPPNARKGPKGNFD